MPVEIEDLLRGARTPDRLDWLRTQGLADDAGLSSVLDQAEAVVHDDPQSATVVLDLCGEAAGRLGLHSVAARGDYLLARLLTMRGELGPALDRIELARSGWLRAGLAVHAARTDLGRMQILDDLGRHGEAAAVGRRLLEEVEVIVPRPSEHELLAYLRAAALENVGVAVSYTGDHEAAIGFYTRADAAYDALGLSAERARPQANLGIELMGLGRAREAQRALTAAAESFAGSGNRIWWAKCQGDLARAHRLLGDLVGALDVLEPARAALEAIGADAEVEAVRLQLAIAGAYLDVGLVTEARHEAAGAAARASALTLAHDAGSARLVLALAELAAGDLDRAGRDLREGARLFEEVGDRRELARIRLVEADIAARSGERGRAAATATEVSHALVREQWPALLVTARLRLADYTDDSEVAREQLAAARPLVETLRSPALDYELRLTSAGLARRTGDTASAEATLRSAISLTETTAIALPDDLRGAFRANRAVAYDELVDLLVARGSATDVREACVTSDHAKTRLLADLVSRAGTDPDVRRAPTTSSRSQRLRDDLSATYAALQSNDVASRRGALIARADELESLVAAQRVRDTLAQPAVATGGTPPSPRAAAPPVGGRSTDRSDPLANLAFHVVGDDLVAFFSCADQVTARRMPDVMGTLDLLTAELAAQWSRFGLGREFTERHLTALEATTGRLLRELHDLLIAPVADLLEAAPGDELVVVPHRHLGNVPFAALHDGSHSLIERWRVSVAPARVRRTPTTRAADASRLTVIAVGDAQAPAVEAEAQGIVDLAPQCVARVGSTATSGFLGAALPGPEILHLACHGVYNDSNPLFSRLRLADRWITCADILDLDLGGALVTLSACESGRAGMSAEPVGLAWAFLAAGASAVVVSRWMVDDTTTATLMSTFYRLLLAGDEPASALRLAQLELMGENSHPYFWAPFTVVRPASPRNATERTA